MDDEKFLSLATALSEAVVGYNQVRVSEIAKDIVRHIIESEGLPPAEVILKNLSELKDSRFFSTLKAIGEALIQSGERSYTVRRLFAQALIDSGDLTSASYVLNDILGSIDDNDPEYAEAKGLIGRYHKQVFVNQKSSTSELAIAHLEKSIQAYDSVYQFDPYSNVWHGINATALKARAEFEGISIVTGQAYKEQATAIIKQIESQGDLSAWDAATLSESYLAVDDGEEALRQCAEFVSDDSVSAFHVGSYARQLREVWRLDPKSGPGSYLFPKLQHAMLHKTGGSVELGDLQRVTPEAKGVLEKTFGKDSAIEASWISDLIDNASSVARIGRSVRKGEGTGFTLRGEDLHPNWEVKPILLTNYHVISPSGQTGGIFWKNAIVSFHGSEAKYKIKEILFQSPPSPCEIGCPNTDHLDVVIAELDSMPPIENYLTINDHDLPTLIEDEGHRVYVIGHPFGGELSYSLQDNKLLDHEAPLIHYHSPTDPGSSGSPVFNGDLELIGIHHAGSLEAPRLNQSPHSQDVQHYAANEGIWVKSLIEKIHQSI